MDKTAQRQLLLYAKPGELKLKSIKELVKPLGDIGFISEGIESGDDHLDYFAGDRFIDHINFLGCSPAIALSPAEGEQYCYVRLHSLADPCQLFSGANTSAPFCRICKQERDKWKDACKTDYCNQCDIQARMQDWAWKKSGALARAAVSIMNVYPHEAVPSPALMEMLEKYSEVGWQYAYL